MNDASYDELSKKIHEFCRVRDWEQYHNPKNLSMSIAIEAAELMEIFQWLTSEESAPRNFDDNKLLAVKEETADIVIYAIRMSQIIGFDLLAAIDNKIAKNDLKYPVEKSRGKASIE